LMAISSGGPVQPGWWHHLAATWDGATLRLYLDGSQVSTAVGTGSINASTQPLNIGRGPATGNYFSGAVDEVAIYGSALTAAQIQTHYKAGRAQIAVAGGAPAQTSQLNFNAVGQLVSST